MWQKLFISKNMPTDFYCEACALGKTQRTPKPKLNNDKNASESKLNSFLKIYWDVEGPLIKSLGGGLYNKRSIFKWIYFLRSKDEVKDKFQLFQNKIRLELGRTIGVLKSNRDGEYWMANYLRIEINVASFIKRRHRTVSGKIVLQNGLTEQLRTWHEQLVNSCSIIRTRILSDSWFWLLWNVFTSYSTNLN